MPFNRDIRWRQGSFLEPQHFQLIDLRRRYENSFLANALRPYAWGLVDFSLNPISLGSHFLEIVKLDLLLPDGRHLKFPENLEIKTGSFKEAFGPGVERLMVYLATPHFFLAGNNARDPRPFSSLSSEDPPPPPDRGQLYRAQEEPDLVPDLLGPGPVGRVETLYYQARVVFGETETVNGFDLIPLARLIRDEDRISLDPTYGPPALTLYPDHPARAILGDVLGLLLARRSHLDEYRLDPALFRSAGLDGSSIGWLSLLGIFGRSLPKLSILRTAPVLHPFTLYQTLAELAGELSLFSPPGAGDSFFLPPKYDHNDPCAALEALKTAISRLLASLSTGPTFSLAFERQEDLFSLELPSEGLEEGSYCLAIRSPLPAPELQALVNWRLRLAPLAKLEFLAAHSLPGIGLIPGKKAPLGLPSRPDLSYFAIRQNDPLWAEARENKNLGLYWPQAPEGVTARLTSG
ncbi:MAG: type VI secretion system baseplate subunit TssK [Deltaproteobacteria bacterium]|jgi:type VI secretion system protein ImpJ|nr:type VI secretion system baseplate subunit TssK [Deltaproteobacteria bacterium]